VLLLLLLLSASGHHHAPAYTTPTAYRVACNPTEPGVDTANCVCNQAGLTKAKAWQGVDCSNFVAFVYNLAFGFYPTSSIGEQACEPTLAPGQMLTTVTLSKLDRLRPGDLAFITLGRTGRTAPVRVSHVVIWTGYTADMKSGASGPLSKEALLANLPTNQQAAARDCMTNRNNAGLPVYVVADSHHMGPALRRKWLQSAAQRPSTAFTWESKHMPHTCLHPWWYGLSLVAPKVVVPVITLFCMAGSPATR